MTEKVGQGRKERQGMSVAVTLTCKLGQGYVYCMTKTSKVLHAVRWSQLLGGNSGWWSWKPRMHSWRRRVSEARGCACRHR